MMIHVKIDFFSLCFDISETESFLGGQNLLAAICKERIKIYSSYVAAQDKVESGNIDQTDHLR